MMLSPLESEIIGETIDVTNCDREPIHIPGFIQPHGLLFTLQEPTLTIIQVSENISEWFGRPAEDFLNQPLSILLGEAELHAIRQCLSGDFEYVNPLRLSFNAVQGPRPVYGIVHHVSNLVIFEVEAISDASEDITYFDFYHQVKSPIAAIQNAATFDGLCNQLVTNIRNITGFDRVMIYRFEDSGSGLVIAEACHKDLNSYLGLHYPASDIPQQARHLYTLNPIRLVPDTSYTPVALIPQLTPIDSTPIDLSLSVLRSISPIHIEYLKNMGVGASMSISLVHNQKLWGLIACHHREPKLIPYFLRTVCEFIGQMAVFELAAHMDSQEQTEQIKLNNLKSLFFEAIAQETDVLMALTRSPQDLLDLVGASGVVIALDNKFTVFGKTPPQEALQPLMNAIAPRLKTAEVWQTACLSQEYPEAEVYSDVVSGLLAIMVSKAQAFYILWFRPEVSQMVTWAGNPNKPVIIEESGEVRLSPRKSFEAWQETVRHTALPWKSCESAAALELRSAIINVALKHADELAELNQELKRSNIELDAFAYVASHDLKEPLRGIHNYSNFLMEDYGEILDADGLSKLKTLTRLTSRMENLIDSLLHYSRLGRLELNWQPVDLNILINEVVDLFQITIRDTLNVVVHDLPIVQGDRTQLNELFTNLVSNAIKYNENSIVMIEIGYTDPATLRQKYPHLDLQTASHGIYIRDNGIGIDALHLQDVFHIFKRLHSHDAYGGGTGAGLTIAQKIADRHGGKLWVESSLGEGSTFYFTIRDPSLRSKK